MVYYDTIRVDCLTKIVEKVNTMPDYKTDCMMGEPHPLDIELHHYSLTAILTTEIDSSVTARDLTCAAYNQNAKRFNQVEIDFIESISRRSEIEWAIHNSFDGLYVRRKFAPETMTTVFAFAVYMKEDHATFWKLKYG